jgi:hypothetical protein
MNYIINKLCLVCFVFISSYAMAQDSSSVMFVGHPDRIKTLDSLIEQSPRLALRKSDYSNAFKKATVATEQQDSLYTHVAIRFFTHLAYGNQAPKLQFDGAKFKLNAYNVPALVNAYVKEKSLDSLVHYFTNSANEVKTLLQTLHHFQDSNSKATTKINLLVKATNEYRWLNAVRQDSRVILVNIPSAQLKAFEGNQIALSMRVVVGKLSTPTNTLSSTVEKIVIHPYWVVPKSIATKEMLAKIVANKDYLANNRFQVLDEDYKVVAPEKIDWNSYSETNLPFTFRQATGYDNSLGVLKVEFNSPFGIYLHDTPEKALFSNKNRFYSHGCMRMEKPMDMGKWLTQNNKMALDTINFKTKNKHPNPKIIKITIPTKVIVWYSLVDFDNKGNVSFYKDWYLK